MLDGISDSIQESRIENLHSKEVDRQSPTGLIFIPFDGGEGNVVRMLVCCCVHVSVHLPNFDRVAHYYAPPLG